MTSVPGSITAVHETDTQKQTDTHTFGLEGKLAKRTLEVPKEPQTQEVIVKPPHDSWCLFEPKPWPQLPLDARGCGGKLPISPIFIKLVIIRPNELEPENECFCVAETHKKLL